MIIGVLGWALLIGIVATLHRKRGCAYASQLQPAPPRVIGELPRSMADAKTARDLWLAKVEILRESEAKAPSERCAEHARSLLLKLYRERPTEIPPPSSRA